MKKDTNFSIIYILSTPCYNNETERKKRMNEPLAIKLRPKKIKNCLPKFNEK